METRGMKGSYAAVQYCRAPPLCKNCTNTEMEAQDEICDSAQYETKTNLCYVSQISSLTLSSTSYLLLSVHEAPPWVLPQVYLELGESPHWTACLNGDSRHGAPHQNSPSGPVLCMKPTHSNVLGSAQMWNQNIPMLVCIWRHCDCPFLFMADATKFIAKCSFTF